MHAIVTYQDVEPNLAGKGPGITLLDSEVRYVGDEVLAVAADTEDIADQALKLIAVEYEELPYVIDPQQALTDSSTLVHTEGNRLAPIMYVGNLYEALPPTPGEQLDTAMSNIISGEAQISELGNVGEGFSKSKKIYEETFTVFPQAVAPLGRLCAVAWWEGENLTVIDSNQAPFLRQSELSSWFQIPMSKIRVIQRYMGCGMGETNTYRYPGIAAALSRKAKRPVKLITNMDYAFVGNQKKRANAQMNLKIGLDSQGGISAIENRAVLGQRAYGVGGPLACTVANLEAYECPNVRDELYPFYTTLRPTEPIGGTAIAGILLGA